MLKALTRPACLFGIHRADGMPLDSFMTRRGPRFIYRCKHCGRIYHKRWS